MLLRLCIPLLLLLSSLCASERHIQIELDNLASWEVDRHHADVRLHVHLQGDTVVAAVWTAPFFQLQRYSQRIHVHAIALEDLTVSAAGRRGQARLQWTPDQRGRRPDALELSWNVEGDGGTWRSGERQGRARLIESTPPQVADVWLLTPIPGDRGGSRARISALMVSIAADGGVAVAPAHHNYQIHRNGFFMGVVPTLGDDEDEAGEDEGDDDLPGQGRRMAIGATFGPILAFMNSFEVEAVQADLRLDERGLGGHFDLQFLTHNRHLSETFPSGSQRFDLDMRRIGGLLLGHFRIGDQQGTALGQFSSQGPTVPTIPPLAPLPSWQEWSIDPALRDAALAESGQALPHGHPVKRPFQLEVGAFFPEDSRRGTDRAFAKTSPMWSERLVRGGSNTLHALRPTAFALEAVEGAQRYRYRLLHGEDELAVFEADDPWSNLEAIWNQSPVLEQLGNTMALRVEGLDAEGQVLGLAEPEISIVRDQPYPGWQVPVPSDMRLRLLAHLRWLLSAPGFTSYNHDIASAFMTYPTQKAGDALAKRCYGLVGPAALLARMTEDQHERAAALALARRVMQWTQSNMARHGGVPTQQNDWAYPMFWIGLAGIELHAADGDQRWLELAEDVAMRLRAIQREDGTWTYTTLSQEIIEGMAGRHHHGLQMREQDASDPLYLFARLRAAGSDADFTAVEQAASDWVRANSAQSFWWRSQWSHNELRGGRIASKTALHFALWLIDHGPGSAEDLELAAQILGFIDDRFTSWSSPGEPLPVGVGEHSANQPLAAPMAVTAHAWLALGQARNNPLDRNRGLAILHAIFASQHLESGMIPGNLHDRPRPGVRSACLGRLTWHLYRAIELAEEQP